MEVKWYVVVNFFLWLEKVKVAQRMKIIMYSNF